MQTTNPKTSSKPKTPKKTQSKKEPAMSSTPTPSWPDQFPQLQPEESTVTVDRRTSHSCLSKWAVPYDSKLKPKKTLYSPYFELGGFDFRFMLYPRGDSLAPPGYLSLYVQIQDPRCCSKFDCFASYKLSILNHEDGSKSLTRESYYRFSVSFNAIKECNISVSAGLSAGLRNSIVNKKGDTYIGRYTWKIGNFTRLKDILKKKKMKGVFLKSRKFQIANHEFRLVVYPRGQSQKPFHLSMFLEVLGPQNATTEWSSFVSYQLYIVDQKKGGISISKESQERCSKDTKELGWSEFVTLTSFFDKDSGYLVQDTFVLGAEVLILKETFKMQDIPESTNNPAYKEADKKRWLITWKLENFFSLKKILATQKIYSKYFQVDQLELRIGVHVLSDTVYAYLECNPSVVNDPDKDFWVSYRMTMVNQKNPAKNFRKESSLHTKTCTNCDLQFMKLSDVVDANDGFVMGEMVTFVCEILDCCPWFDFSELEVLGDVTATELHETTSSGTCKVSGCNVDISSEIVATGRGHFNVEDNASPVLALLKEEFKGDLRSWAVMLVATRLYLDNPVKLHNFLHQLTGIDTGQIVNEDKFLFKEAIRDADFMRQKIDNALLDVMVECCQRINRKSGRDPYDASSKPYLDNNETSSQSKFHWKSRLANFFRSPVQERFRGIHDCMENGGNMSEKANYAHHDSSSESESFEGILEFIVNSLKALDDAVTQDPLVSSQGCQYLEKILVLLDEVPKHLLPDLVFLLPKLAYQCKHKVVATALLDQLQKPGVESSMRLPVLEAMCQLHFGIDVWERTYFHASEVVHDLNGEALGSAIRLLFKAASECQHIPQAACIVRQRLERLGAEVSHYVLDLLRKMLNSSADLAGTMLQEIDSVFSSDQKHWTNCIRPLSSSNNGLATGSLHAGDHHFSNIFMLLVMLAIPSIAIETTHTFEKGIANGFIMDRLVEMVLEKCASILGVNVVSSEKHQFGDTETARKGSMDSLYSEEVFTLVFGLADKLFLSRHSQVHGFLKKFYSILFRLFADENHQKKMLRQLVDHSTSDTDNFSKTSIDVLVFLVHEECEVARLVLSMIIGDIQIANSDRSALQIQLRAREDENIRTEDELQTELAKIRTEKLALLERLDKSEADNLHYKSEIRLERDRFAQEKKELSEQEQAAKREFQHTCSKQQGKLVTLSNEKKFYQDTANDLKVQLSKLKAKNKQELKKLCKEKNVLAEKLRNAAEADRKRFDEERRRLTFQVAAQQEAQQSLLDEIQQLKQNLEQVRQEKQEKEDEVARYKTCNDELNMQLNNSQQCVQFLKLSLEKEMLLHAPLYGVGLQDLSMNELEILSGIHEDGLRNIRAIQHSVRSETKSPPPYSTADTLENFDGDVPSSPTSSCFSQQ
ncbi:TRAF-like family protein [Corchorus capsularis]|uniref:TRAF-like family protein n=1 Tax=Corchorus capsularis TaxID=210143 RepID=A0A1R3IF71_COCAP|nr:TRAF-like family protein [Corchorus capsularis]